MSEEVTYSPKEVAEAEAGYIRSRDSYVAARDTHIALLRESQRVPESELEALLEARSQRVPESELEALLEARSQYAIAYGTLERMGVTPEPPPPDPRYVVRDRSTKEVEVAHE
jgi:hypothetical protein